MDISRNSLVDQVYSVIRTEIITLKRPLGSRFNVNEVKDELKVSSTPIREAINRLQQEGLMTYENNVGARIISLTEHDVDEINELALSLHNQAICLAIQRGNMDVIIRDLKKYLSDYKLAQNENDEVYAIYNFIGTYHHNCNNNRMEISMKGIQGQQLLLRWIYAKSQPERHADTSYIETMLNATQMKNAQAVCNELNAYTKKTTPYILKFIESNQE